MRSKSAASAIPAQERPVFMLASWLTGLFQPWYVNGNKMSDVIDILGTSGEITLDELRLRSGEEPEQLEATLHDLCATGLIEIEGDFAQQTGVRATLNGSTTNSHIIVRLTRRAFAAGALF